MIYIDLISNSPILQVGLLFTVSTIISTSAIMYILNRKSQKLEYFLNHNLQVLGEAFGLDLSTGQKENASMRGNLSKQIKAGEKSLHKTSFPNFQR